MIGEQRPNLPLSSYYQPATETRVEGESRNAEGSRDSLHQGFLMDASIERGPPAQGNLTLHHGGNSKWDVDASCIKSSVPYGLKWTEHEMDLRPVRSLKISDDPEITPGVFPRLGHSCTAIPDAPGEFIIFGGRTGRFAGDAETWTDDVNLLSTTNMSLTRLETYGTKPDKGRHRAVLAGRVLVIFGGDNYLHFLDLDTREWSRLRPPLPYPGPRDGHSFIMVDKAVWLYGGEHGYDFKDDMWRVDLTTGIDNLRWREIPKKDPWPEARTQHSTVFYNGCLYLFGGRYAAPEGHCPYVNDLWKFDLSTETWTRVQYSGLPPQPRESHTVTVIGDNMFVFGGGIPTAKRDEYFFTDDAYAFDFRDYTWRSLAMLGHTPAPTAEGTLLALDSQLILVGGHMKTRQCIHFAEIRAAGQMPDSLARLQFTTETTKLKFTTDVVDLSRFVRKRGSSAHALAGFSDVWKGEMTETGQPIAIKVLRVTTTDNPHDPESSRLRKRFDRELTIWMKCQHPRVLELLGYAYIEGIPCLISPWCSKGNIMEFLVENPDNNRLQLTMQVAEGLVYLHGREPPVIHSDVKPANVLISDEGDAKICDFGISKLLMDAPSGLTTTKSANWTLRYSAKELLCEGKNTEMSDVHAFGMFILEVMTNKPPFFGISREAMVVMAIMNGRSPSMEDYPELPAADRLWDLMGECWRQEPSERPTMVDVLDKLRPYAETREASGP